jgi:TP901 family phage tail tape measure protein
MPSFGLGKGTLLGVGYIKVEADTSAAETKLGSLGKGLAVGATGFLALAAAGTASVKMASDFNNEMLKVQTQAGGSAADVKTLSTQILNMKDVQQSPMQLAEAMYHLKSVGLDNVTAMKDLKVASDLAAVGGSNLEATTNALAGAWRSGIKGAQDMSMAASSVNAIIGAGNMTMSQFVAAIGTGILPSARTFGLSLNQVGAALALMTDEGIPAVDAATRLRMSFSLLGAPSKAADKQLGKIGLTGLELAQAMRGPDGLIGAIQLLKDHLDASGLSAAQQSEILSRAFGGGRSNSAILTMLNNLSTLKMKQDQINGSMGAFPAAVQAQQHTLSAQIAILKNNLESMGIKIGEVLIGPVTAFVSFLNGMAVPAISRFAAALSKPLEGVGQAVSGLAASGFFQSLMGTGSKTFTAGTQGTVLQGPHQALAPDRAVMHGGVTPAQLSAGPPTGLAQAGAALHTIFADVAKAIGDVVKAALNLWGAIQPFVTFLGTVGLGVLTTLAQILANQVGPALVAVSKFLKDNSGLIKILLEVYLTPLALKMAAMSVIKPVVWFSQLAKDIVMFPVGQITSMKDGITDFFKAGGGFDTFRLKLGAVGDAFKSGAGKALEFGKNVGSAIAQGAGNVWDTIRGGLSSVAMGLRMAAENAVAFAKNMAAAIAEGAASAWEGLVSGVSQVTMGLKMAAAATWDFVTAAAAATATALKQAATFVIEKTAELASAAAEGLMTAAQWLLDAAMSANPITLIILALIALAAGFAYLWTHSAAFREFWIMLWNVLKGTALSVWHFLDQGVFQPLAAAFNFLWTDVVKPVLRFIVDSFLGFAQTMIDGAAKAFGWIPGLGGMLKNAAHAFDNFVNSVNQSLGGIQPKTVPVTISFNGVPEGQITGHTYTSTTGFSYASGGPIPMNIGTPGKDSVPILAMPGEYIVRASEVPKHIGLLNKINAGQLKGYASGGIVGFDNAVSADMRQAAQIDISRQTTKIVSAYVKANNDYWAKIGSLYGGSIPSGQHLAIINAALAAAGVPPPGTLGQWQLGLDTLITRESGWNPMAQNNTDINAQNGDPSRGLAQTIMSTFLAYVPASLKSLGIFNPIANVAAAVRYILAVYGSISNVQQANPNLPPMGYDSGGLALGMGLLPKFTPRPERILSPRQTESFDRLVGVLDRGGAPGGTGSRQPLEVHVHFNGPVGSKRELENWLIEALTNAKRNNRLAGIVS